MINFDDVTKENIKEHNPSWSQFPDHTYRLVVTGGSRSGKTNSLSNLISHQSDIDKIYLYAKNHYEAKNQLQINKQEIAGLENSNGSKAFI